MKSVEPAPSFEGSPDPHFTADNRTVFRWSLALAVLGVCGGLLARDWASVAAALGIGLYGLALWRGWIRE